MSKDIKEYSEELKKKIIEKISYEIRELKGKIISKLR